MQNLSFSSPALHFVMRAVFRPNLLFQRWLIARCFTGGGVCFAVCKHTHVFGTLMLDKCGFFQRIRWQNSPQSVRGWWSSKCVARPRLNIMKFCSTPRRASSPKLTSLSLHQWVQCASSMSSSCPRLTTTKKTTILGTSSWILSRALRARIQLSWAELDLPFCDGRSVCGEGCLTMIDSFGLPRRVQLQRRLSFLMRKRRAPILKTPKNVDFLSTAFAPVPLATDSQNTRRARRTRRPSVSECRDETTCLHPNVLTGHKVSPDGTRQKARHSKWNCRRTLQPTSANQKRATNRRATKSHCCRNQERTKRNTTDTMEGPETTAITPFARDRQHF